MTLRFAACAAAVVLTLGAETAAPRAEAAPNAVLLHRLAAVENEAEAIAEAEVTGARARAAAARAAAAWRTARPQVAVTRANGSVAVLDAAIAALRADRDPARLRRDGNEVTGALAPLFGVAGDGVPVDLHLLDYLGRSIALDARASDWSRAEADSAALSRSWYALRPRIADLPRGAAAAVAYDAVARDVAAAVRARSVPRTLAAATRSADRVDALEGFFGG